MRKIFFSFIFLFTVSTSFGATSVTDTAPTDSTHTPSTVPSSAPTTVPPTSVPLPGATSVSTDASTTASAPFALHTSAFTGQNPLPALYTCDGKDLSPEIDWSGIPAKTESLVFMLSDPDAPGGTFYHWVLYNIPKTILSIPEGAQQVPDGVLVGKNSGGTINYKGPCPPKGSTHRYLFTLYALDATLKLKPGADPQEVLDAMQNHIIDKVEISTIFGH